MKNLLLLTTLVSLSFATFAQKTTFGICSGVNFATTFAYSKNYNYSTSKTSNSLATFSIGGFADFSFKNFSIQPALVLTGKGGETSAEDGSTVSLNLHYLEIPVNIIYRIPVLAAHIYFGAGPYIAFGTGGSIGANEFVGENPLNVTFGGSGDLNVTEAGLNGIAGVQLKSGFLFRINYDHGLSNIINQKGPEAGLGSLKTRTLGLSVGFAF